MTAAGDAESAKFGVAEAFTVRFSVVVCIRLPEVPVIVTIAAPVAAALLAVSVSVLEPVVLVGLNDAVTPLGNPDADSATLPVNPLVGVSVIVAVVLAPCVTDTVVGVAESAKSGAGAVALIVRLKVVECTTEPDVPVTVTVDVPVAAAADAVSVNVEFALPFAAGVTVAGENVPVTPLGRPDTVRFTAELKPPVLAIVTVSEPDVPCVKLRELAVDAVEKSGAAVALLQTSVIGVAVAALPRAPSPYISSSVRRML